MRSAIALFLPQLSEMHPSDKLPVRLDLEPSSVSERDYSAGGLVNGVLIR